MLKEEKDHKPLKRISIVSIKMIRESSILYNTRRIGKPEDIVDLGKKIWMKRIEKSLLLHV